MGARNKNIYLVGSVGKESCAEFLRDFHAADATPGPITVYVNCSGGEVTSGNAIYDAIRTSRNHVTTWGIGEVASMGTLIYAAGDYRVMTEGTSVLVHDGDVTVDNTIVKARAEMNEVWRSHEWYAQQLGACTRKTADFWLQVMEREAYFTAFQAKHVGLVDEVVLYRPRPKSARPRRQQTPQRKDTKS
jgi:ATP-dependent Clp protease, protease subunit